MVEEQILEMEQELRGLAELEKEAKAIEEADAKAVEEAREKKRLRRKKARRRKLLSGLIFLFIIALVTGGCFFQKKKKEKAASASVEIIVEEGQHVVYAQIEQIQGNEISYAEMEKTVSKAAANDRQREKAKMPTGTGSDMPQQISYTATGNTGVTQIPAGTEVTTILGAVTTFSRLGAGDIIAIVMENDEIIRVYIVA